MKTTATTTRTIIWRPKHEQRSPGLFSVAWLPSNWTSSDALLQRRRRRQVLGALLVASVRRTAPSPVRASLTKRLRERAKRQCTARNFLLQLPRFAPMCSASWPLVSLVSCCLLCKTVSPGRRSGRAGKGRIRTVQCLHAHTHIGLDTFLCMRRRWGSLCSTNN